jgi:hypothetical protein
MPPYSTGTIGPKAPISARPGMMSLLKVAFSKRSSMMASGACSRACAPCRGSVSVLLREQLVHQVVVVAWNRSVALSSVGGGGAHGEGLSRCQRIGRKIRKGVGRERVDQAPTFATVMRPDPLRAIDPLNAEWVTMFCCGGAGAAHLDQRELAEEMALGGTRAFSACAWAGRQLREEMDLQDRTFLGLVLIGLWACLPSSSVWQSDTFCLCCRACASRSLPLLALVVRGRVGVGPSVRGGLREPACGPRRWVDEYLYTDSCSAMSPGGCSLLPVWYWWLTGWSGVPRLF